MVSWKLLVFVALLRTILTYGDDIALKISKWKNVSNPKGFRKIYDGFQLRKNFPCRNGNANNRSCIPRKQQLTTYLKSACNQNGNQTECRKRRNLNGKGSLVWYATQWTHCLPLNDNELTPHYLKQINPWELKANDGYSYRNITCAMMYKNRKDREIEYLADDGCGPIGMRPQDIKMCNLIEIQDCIVSKFGAWTSCDNCRNFQMRFRKVIVAPRNRGMPCPELSEKRKCLIDEKCLKIQNSRKSLNQLKVREWGDCGGAPSIFFEEGTQLLIDGRMEEEDEYIFVVDSVKKNFESVLLHQPQVGLQIRDIVCQSSDGKRIDILNCTGKISPISKMRACIVPQDCDITEFSQWNRLNRGCLQENGDIRPEVFERERMVSQISAGNGIACEHLVERKEVRQGLKYCKDKFVLVPSKWSNCFVFLDDKKIPVGCGGGIRTRSVTCVETEELQPVALSNCRHLNPESIHTLEHCEETCPTECQLGMWEPWSSCKIKSCTSHLFPEKSFRVRHRPIIVEPSFWGTQCPYITESQPCETNSCWKWKAFDWEKCLLVNGKSCGSGVRFRRVLCVDQEDVPTNASFCPEAKPMEKEPCRKPCPYDCAVSEWSPWSLCNSTCVENNVTPVKKRTRSILGLPDENGQPCPAPKDLIEIKPCNNFPCKSYHWKPMPWGYCQLFTNDLQTIDETKEERRCGNGIQIREYWCLRNDGIKVDYKHCANLPHPVTKRPCDVPCPGECIKSEWSDWTVCPEDCKPDDFITESGSELAPNQRRERVVLNSTNAEHPDCQYEEQSRPCPMAIHRCDNYIWAVTKWSPCQLPANTDSGKGFRTRGVWCAFNHNENVVQMGYCLKKYKFTPQITESCYVFSNSTCVVSEWSQWSRCTKSCRRSVRTREKIKLHMIGLKNYKHLLSNLGEQRRPCPKDLPLIEERPCQCEKYRLLIDEFWSSCIIKKYTVAHVNGVQRDDICGQGVRYKQQVCINQDGKPVELNLCEVNGTSLIEDTCEVPCPVDCQLGPWLPWEPCSTICGIGTQKRYRKILKMPYNNGRLCEETVQERSCKHDCSPYQWDSIRSDCNTFLSKCGRGEITATVRCVNTTNLKAVSHEFCDPATKPRVIEDCYISCPGECAYSDWSDWSVCSDGCAGFRNKTREILRQGDIYNNKNECLPNIRVERCHLNENCFLYKWAVTEYGACILLGDSPCGLGTQSRNAFCQRNDHAVVNDRFCIHLTIPFTLEKKCNVICPIDCDVGKWNDWDSSSCFSNAAGKIVRSRKVLIKPSETGRPCPEILKQTKPCVNYIDYKWHREPWSRCQVKEGNCGFGIRTRSITCRRGLTTVPKKLCLNYVNQISIEEMEKFIRTKLNDFDLIRLDIHEEEECKSSCNSDCKLTPWSPWSECHRRCNPFFQQGGYATRSRVVFEDPKNLGESCPERLWETKPCTSDRCLSYSWVLVGNNSYCQRSDGLHVEGGCSIRNKPCPTPCSKAMTCVNGTCICKLGLRQMKNGTIKCIDPDQNSALWTQIELPNQTGPNVTEKLFQDFNSIDSYIVEISVVLTICLIFCITFYVILAIRCSRREGVTNNVSSIRLRLQKFKTSTTSATDL